MKKTTVLLKIILAILIFVSMVNVASVPIEGGLERMTALGITNYQTTFFPMPFYLVLGLPLSNLFGISFLVILVIFIQFAFAVAVIMPPFVTERFSYRGKTKKLVSLIFTGLLAVDTVLNLIFIFFMASYLWIQLIYNVIILALAVFIIIFDKTEAEFSKKDLMKRGVAFLLALVIILFVPLPIGKINSGIYMREGKVYNSVFITVAVYETEEGKTVKTYLNFTNAGREKTRYALSGFAG